MARHRRADNSGLVRYYIVTLRKPSRSHPGTMYYFMSTEDWKRQGNWITLGTTRELWITLETTRKLDNTGNDEGTVDNTGNDKGNVDNTGNDKETVDNTRLFPVKL